MLVGVDRVFVGDDGVNVSGCQLGWSRHGWALRWQHLVRSTHISRQGGACDVAGLIGPNNTQILLVYKGTMNH